jgi:hypothetical protein
MSTVTYAYPVSGTVAPAIAQALGCNMLTCQIQTSDADTTATITHNWQLTTAQLNNLWPTIKAYISSAGTASPLLSWALTNSVSVTMTKVSSVGTGGTIVLILERPFSAIT